MTGVTATVRIHGTADDVGAVSCVLHQDIVLVDEIVEGYG